jgi:hypothetical protein
MSEDSWKTYTIDELELAKDARSGGNEGRARVCARRAAGYIADEYLRRQGIHLESTSALTRLKYLATLPNISAPISDTVNHFLVHTTPEHKLPIDADLINDVYFLAKELLGEKIGN